MRSFCSRAADVPVKLRSYTIIWTPWSRDFKIAWITNHMFCEVWDENIFYSQISTEAPLKFENGGMISSHIL